MTYLSNVDCENCHYRGDLEIPEGLAVSEMPCPECRTKSLRLFEEKAPEKPNEESTPE